MCVAGGFGEGSGTVLIFEALVCSTRMGRHGNNLTARSSLCLGRVCGESQQKTQQSKIYRQTLQVVRSLQNLQGRGLFRPWETQHATSKARRELCGRFTSARQTALRSEQLRQITRLIREYVFLSYRLVFIIARRPPLRCPPVSEEAKSLSSSRNAPPSYS